MGCFSFSFNVPAISWVSLLWKSLVNAIFYWLWIKRISIQIGFELENFRKKYRIFIWEFLLFFSFLRTFFPPKNVRLQFCTLNSAGSVVVLLKFSLCISIGSYTLAHIHNGAIACIWWIHMHQLTSCSSPAIVGMINILIAVFSIYLIAVVFDVI